MFTDPYAILGVSPNATDEEVKKAYRQMSRKYHPDANIGAPNPEQIEEKFKEIQQAYQKIMETREQGYSSGSYYGSGNGSESWRSQYADEDGLKMQAAVNYINSRHFTEALHVLSGIDRRSAQWYYLSAISNAGIGNNINAKSLAQQAVALEPDNQEFRMLLQQLEFGGSWYSSMGNTYGSPLDANNYCFKLCLANLFCSCCCRPC